MIFKDYSKEEIQSIVRLKKRNDISNLYKSVIHKQDLGGYKLLKIEFKQFHESFIDESISGDDLFLLFDSNKKILPFIIDDLPAKRIESKITHLTYRWFYNSYSNKVSDFIYFMYKNDIFLKRALKDISRDCELSLHKNINEIDLKALDEDRSESFDEIISKVELLNKIGHSFSKKTIKLLNKIDGLKDSEKSQLLPYLL